MDRDGAKYEVKANFQLSLNIVVFLYLISFVDLSYLVLSSSDYSTSLIFLQTSELAPCLLSTSNPFTAILNVCIVYAMEVEKQQSD